MEYLQSWLPICITVVFLYSESGSSFTVVHMHQEATSQNWHNNMIVSRSLPHYKHYYWRIRQTKSVELNSNVFGIFFAQHKICEQSINLNHMHISILYSHVCSIKIETNWYLLILQMARQKGSFFIITP